MKTRTVLIIIAILAAICICITACGLIAITQAGRIISSAATTDPAKAANTGQGIANYTLPQGYKEATSASILGMSMVLINGSDGQPLFFLFQAPPGVQMSQGQIEQQFRQLLNQPGKNAGTFTQVGTRSVTIRGQPVELVIYESSNAGGANLHEEIGSFQGKNGTAFLMMMGPSDTWDQAAVDSFIASMK